MKPNREDINAALRRQIEAQDRDEERREQWRAELYADAPHLRQWDESPAGQASLQSAAKQLAESWERYDIIPQMQGFVAGWLVGSGQFERYADLLQIWLDTVSKTDIYAQEPPEATITQMLSAIASRSATGKRRSKKAG